MRGPRWGCFFSQSLSAATSFFTPSSVMPRASSTLGQSSGHKVFSFICGTKVISKSTTVLPKRGPRVRMSRELVREWPLLPLLVGPPALSFSPRIKNSPLYHPWYARKWYQKHNRRQSTTTDDMWSVWMFRGLLLVCLYLPLHKVLSFVCDTQFILVTQ